MSYINERHLSDEYKKQREIHRKKMESTCKTLSATEIALIAGDIKPPKPKKKAAPKITADRDHHHKLRPGSESDRLF